MVLIFECNSTRVTTEKKESGFLEGRLARIDNQFGAFVGVVDMSAYMDKHDIADDAVGKKAPFEKPLIGFKHYVERGADEDLEIAITQVMPFGDGCDGGADREWRGL